MNKTRISILMIIAMLLCVTPAYAGLFTSNGYTDTQGFATTDNTVAAVTESAGATAPAVINCAPITQIRAPVLEGAGCALPAYVTSGNGAGSTDYVGEAEFDNENLINVFSGLEDGGNYVAIATTNGDSDEVYARFVPQSGTPTPVMDFCFLIPGGRTVTECYASESSTSVDSINVECLLNDNSIVISNFDATGATAEMTHVTNTIYGAVGNPVGGLTTDYFTAIVGTGPTTGDINVFHGSGVADNIFGCNPVIDAAPGAGIASIDADADLIIAYENTNNNVVIAPYVAGVINGAFEETSTLNPTNIFAVNYNPTPSNYIIGTNTAILSFDGPFNAIAIDDVYTPAPGQSFNDIATDTTNDLFYATGDMTGPFGWIGAWNIAGADTVIIDGAELSDMTSSDKISLDQNDQPQAAGIDSAGNVIINTLAQVSTTSTANFVGGEEDTLTPDGGNTVSVVNAFDAATNGIRYIGFEDSSGSGFVFEGDNEDTAPEFSTIALFIAVTGVIGGLLIIRRRGEQQ